MTTKERAAERPTAQRAQYRPTPQQPFGLFGLPEAAFREGH